MVGWLLLQVATFLDVAVAFCNDSLFGSLSCSLLAPQDAAPATM